MNISSVSSNADSAAVQAKASARASDENAVRKPEATSVRESAAGSSAGETRQEAAPKAEPVEAFFSVDQDTRQTVIRIVDAGTQEVILETPPEKIRKLAESLEKFTEAHTHSLDTRM